MVVPPTPYISYITSHIIIIYNNYIVKYFYIIMT